jgi:hypothetical protein
LANGEFELIKSTILDAVSPQLVRLIL